MRKTFRQRGLVALGLRVLAFFGFLCFLTLLGSTPVIAAPAFDGDLLLKQPDGSTFIARAKGDEWNNWTETKAGFVVERGSSGFWHYVRGYGPKGKADLDPTPAHVAPPPGLNKHILPPLRQRPAMAPFDGTGTLSSPSFAAAATTSSETPVLFILTEFTNRLGGTSEAAWESFVTTKLQDYYLKTSHGNALMTPATESSGTFSNGVIVWVNVGYNHPNTGGTIDSRNQKLAADAILAANPYVNFANYDRNGDGYITGTELSVVTVVAGYDTSYGGTAGALTPNVWGHKWGWSSSAAPVVDGKRVLSYAQFGEYHATSTANQHQATVGIMAHELGHLAHGLPDLYDTDGSSSGIGGFCLMSGGSWGRASNQAWSGESPVNASAWVKYAKGWVTGDGGSGSVSILASGEPTATSANTVFRASSPITGQYFLVENRRPVGYDRGLERYLGANFAGGIAIWHVDESMSSNATDSHRKVDLEEADGTEMGTGSGAAPDLWFSRSGIAFDDTTTPNARLYNGSLSGVLLRDISASANVMTVTFGTATPTNNPPVAVNDIATTNQNTAVTIAVLSNDSDPDGDPLSLLSVGTPANGTATISGSSILYTPNSGFVGNNSFSYTASDGRGGTATATVTVTVQQVVTIPSAPSGLIASVASGVVTLQWTDNSTNETSFQIQRETWNTKKKRWTSATILGTVGANVTTYQNTPAPHATYRYSVRAVNSAGNSAWATAQIVVP